MIRAQKRFPGLSAFALVVDVGLDAAAVVLPATGRVAIGLGF